MIAARLTVVLTILLKLLAVKGHEADEGHEVRVGPLLLEPGLDLGGDVHWQDLHHRLGRELSHAVILDWSSRQI